MRDAGADRDRPGVHVAIVDVPAFLAGVFRLAEGELGHAPLKRSTAGQAIDLWRLPQRKNNVAQPTMEHPAFKFPFALFRRNESTISA
jgi:hypothetical protein